MTTTRRDFIKTTAATAASLAAYSRLGSVYAQTLPAPGADPAALELAMEALNVARGAGALYADVRVGRYRSQSIDTRERQVSGVSDSESYGLGVRTLVNGCWGFAATSTMTRAGVQAAAREAAALVARGPGGAEAPRGARAGGARDRHVDHAGAPRSARGLARGQDRDAAGRERSGAEGEEREVRELGPRLASRGQDARHLRGHERHADAHPRRAVVLGHGRRRRRFPDLRAGARAPGRRVGVRRVAEHARQRRTLGVARRREAHREVAWTRGSGT